MSRFYKEDDGINYEMNATCIDLGLTYLKRDGLCPGLCELCRKFLEQGKLVQRFPKKQK